MSVVVKNESSEPWYFIGNAQRKHALQPGDIQVISEAELDTIPIPKRGLGQINILWPQDPVVPINVTGTVSVNEPVSVDGSVTVPGVATESTLSDILDAIGELGGFTDDIETLLTALGLNTDTIEALLIAIRDNADTVETKLQSIIDNTDGIEGLLTALNGYVDTVESLIGTTNTLLTSVSGYVDGLEGFTDGIEGLLTTLNGYVDQLEGFLSGTLTVAGTVTANAGTGPWPVTDNGGSLTVDDGDGSITVDGSVTANIGTTGGLALDTTLTGGTQKAIARGGAKGTTISADITSTASGADHQAIDTVQMDAAGNILGTLTNPIITSPSPSLTGGTSVYRNINVNNTGVEIKGSSGNIYGWHLHNDASGQVRYVKLYNTYAGAVPTSTDTPALTIPVPEKSAINAEFDLGISFGNRIGIRATTGIADTDTGNPSANEVVVNILYK